MGRNISLLYQAFRSWRFHHRIHLDSAEIRFLFTGIVSPVIRPLLDQNQQYDHKQQHQQASRDNPHYHPHGHFAAARLGLPRALGSFTPLTGETWLTRAGEITAFVGPRARASVLAGRGFAGIVCLTALADPTGRARALESRSPRRACSAVLTRARVALVNQVVTGVALVTDIARAAEAVCERRAGAVVAPARRAELCQAAAVHVAESFRAVAPIRIEAQPDTRPVVLTGVRRGRTRRHERLAVRALVIDRAAAVVAGEMRPGHVRMTVDARAVVQTRPVGAFANVDVAIPAREPPGAVAVVAGGVVAARAAHARRQLLTRVRRVELAVPAEVARFAAAHVAADGVVTGKRPVADARPDGTVGTLVDVLGAERAVVARRARAGVRVHAVHARRVVGAVVRGAVVDVDAAVPARKSRHARARVVQVRVRAVPAILARLRRALVGRLVAHLPIIPRDTVAPEHVHTHLTQLRLVGCHGDVRHIHAGRVLLAGLVRARHISREIAQPPGPALVARALKLVPNVPTCTSLARAWSASVVTMATEFEVAKTRVEARPQRSDVTHVDAAVVVIDERKQQTSKPNGAQAALQRTAEVAKQHLSPLEERSESGESAGSAVERAVHGQVSRAAGAVELDSVPLAITHNNT